MQRCISQVAAYVDVCTVRNQDINVSKVPFSRSYMQRRVVDSSSLIGTDEVDPTKSGCLLYFDRTSSRVVTELQRGVCDNQVSLITSVSRGLRFPPPQVLSILPAFARSTQMSFTLVSRSINASRAPSTTSEKGIARRAASLF